MSKEYPSNLTHDQFDLLSDLLPPAKLGGRSRYSNLYKVINAILSLLVEGMRQRATRVISSVANGFTYCCNWRKETNFQLSVSLNIF